MNNNLQILQGHTFHHAACLIYVPLSNSFYFFNYDFSHLPQALAKFEWINLQVWSCWLQLWPQVHFNTSCALALDPTSKLFGVCPNNFEPERATLDTSQKGTTAIWEGKNWQKLWLLLQCIIVAWESQLLNWPLRHFSHVCVVPSWWFGYTLLLQLLLVRDLWENLSDQAEATLFQLMTFGKTAELQLAIL